MFVGGFMSFHMCPFINNKLLLFIIYIYVHNIAFPFRKDLSLVMDEKFSHDAFSSFSILGTIIFDDTMQYEPLSVVHNCRIVKWSNHIK